MCFSVLIGFSNSINKNKNKKLYFLRVQMAHNILETWFDEIYILF
jgi:hypothetical protein